jgi:hypothetical protein
VRRGASVGAALVAFAMIGALAAWLLAPSLMIPSHRMVGWELQGFPGRVSDTAATSTSIEVFVRSWPTEFNQGDDSWLEQRVIETPVSVTITLHTTDAYESGPALRSWYDTGGWVTVNLRAPLGGRLLFDGSGFPPQPRW